MNAVITPAPPPAAAITSPMLRKFAQTARHCIRLDGGGYRRDHLRSLV